jgi:hypothetical protein
LKIAGPGVSLGFFVASSQTTQRLSARFEVCRRLTADYNGRNAFQIVMELTEMIQRVEDPDKTRT